MHTKLRVRTVCELALNERYYLWPEVMAFCGGYVDENSGQSKNKSAQASLHLTSSSWVEANSKAVPDDSDIARETFILDCLNTTKAGTYCNMWHIHALASVLRSPIRSVYPDYNQYIRPLLNKTVTPREGGSIATHYGTLHIMWT